MIPLMCNYTVDGKNLAIRLWREVQHHISQALSLVAANMLLKGALCRDPERLRFLNLRIARIRQVKRDGAPLLGGAFLDEPGVLERFECPDHRRAVHFHGKREIDN